MPQSKRLFVLFLVTYLCATPLMLGYAIADDPAQHKQSHVIQLLDAENWTGNIVALPNNRVRATSPALWRTGDGVPDFTPSQWTHSAESHQSYLDPSVTFNNLYASK